MTNGAAFFQRLRWLLPATLALLMCLPLAGYYPFLHLQWADGRWVSIPERFDLRETPGGAVPFVVTRAIEPQWDEGDGWEAALSQVRLAAEEWSSISTSSLRLRFAGETPLNGEASTPHIQVLFEELPPGVIAMAGPVSVSDTRHDAHGAFKPIAKSMVIHSADLRHRPSYSEAFFLTMVHELGHAIGLQHTFTSSTMSTGVTRSTTKASPLAPDDHAGASWLYPGRFFAEETGTLRGRVLMDGEGLHFASVVALLPSGEAVSALTLPDGSYEIRGLPQGQYYVFAQAVPPSSDPSLGPGQIVLPVDEEGQTIFPGPSFGTRFYPDARTWQDAFLVEILAGNDVTGIDIEVPRQGQSAFRGVSTYSFLGGAAVNPAIVNGNGDDPYLVAYGPNLTDGEQRLDGLEVEAIGASVWDDGVFAYPWAPEFLQVGISLNPFSVTGPKTLVWKRYGDAYVQPAAFHLVGQVPPQLTDVTAESDETGEALVVHGDELGAVESYLLDGLRIPATRSENAGLTGTESRLLDAELNLSTRLRMPFTSDGRLVRVVALGRDSQSSLFLDASAPQAPSRVAASGSIHLQPSSLPAGTEAMVLLTSAEPLFAGDSLWVDFGSPSVVATQVWKRSAHELLVNVAVAKAAQPGRYGVAIHNDLALRVPSEGLAVIPGNGSALHPRAVLRDVATGADLVYPGALAELQFAEENLPGSPDGQLEIQLGDYRLAAYQVSNGVYRFQIPAEIDVGVTTWKVVGASGESLPIAVEIFGRPPQVIEASVTPGLTGLSEEVRISLRFRLLAELPEATATENLQSSLRVRVNGRTIPSVQFSADSESPNRVGLSFWGRLPLAEAQDMDIRLQVEYLGRLSPVYLTRLGATPPGDGN